MTPTTPTQEAEGSFKRAKAHAHIVHIGQGDLKEMGLAIQHLSEGLGSLTVALRQTYKLLAKVDSQTAPKGFAGRVEIGTVIMEP